VKSFAKAGKVFLCFFILFLTLVLPSQAATYTVENTNDSGLGSLRQAILDANADPGPDIIEFNIDVSDPNYIGMGSWGYWRIRPSSPLPSLTANAEGSIISGESQTANRGNTNPYGPEIVIDGSLAGGNGISLQTNNCKISGLTINKFSVGILIQGNSNEVINCFLGTDASGEVAAGNTYGVRIDSGSTNNTIRGNVISGNSDSGVAIVGSGANSNRILGNYIGTNRNATSAVGNAYGVWIKDGEHTFIGSEEGSGYNIICGNTRGVLLENASYTKIKGNYIGTNNNYASNLGNSEEGIYAQNSSFLEIGEYGGNFNVIGNNGLSAIGIKNGYNDDIVNNFVGTDPSGTKDLGNRLVGLGIESSTQELVALNTIAYNGKEMFYSLWPPGIVILGSSSGRGTWITQNSIYENGGFGILLYNGGNQNIAAPIINRAVVSGGNTLVSGTSSTLGGWIEIFRTNGPDPSGSGEGKVYLGSTEVDSTGRWNFTYPSDLSGSYLTATVTDANWHTSMFSQNCLVTTLTAPQISAVSPVGKGISTNAIISIAFSRAMSREAVERAISISPRIYWQSNWEQNDSVLRIFPLPSLSYGTSYTVTILETAQDQFGNQLRSPYAFNFTTVTTKGVDVVSPEVLTTVPAQGARQVSLRPTISITFSEYMNRDSVESAITLPQEGNPWKASWYGSMVMFVPGRNLSAANTYTVNIGAGAKDLAGNYLANPKNISFTTLSTTFDNIPPEITAVSAGSGVEEIFVTFSEPISQETLAGNIEVRKVGGDLVSGSLRWEESSNTAYFTPAESFASGGEYTLTVKTGITDLAGNHLLAGYTSGFMAMDVSGPAIGEVKFDGRNYLENDVISPTAVISAEVLDASGLNYNEISLKMGPRTVTRSDFKATDVYSGNQLQYEISPALGEGSYMITIEAQDMRGNVGRWEGKVRVYGGEAEIVPGTQVFAVPSRISPMKAMQAGEEVKVTMVYNLTSAADIDLHIYGPEGRLVWGRRYNRGTMGGQAGYNAVSWSGRDLSGKVVGNGLYVFKVIRGGRAIGQGVIVVLD